MAVLIVILLSSLLLCAFGSLLEASLSALSGEEIVRLGRSKPRTGRTLRFFQEELSATLLWVRILKNLILSAGAVLAGVRAYRLFGGPFWPPLFALVYGVLHAGGSETLAAALGARYARPLAPWLALPLQPLLWILSLAERLKARLWKPASGRESRKREKAALKEISGLVRLASLNARRERDPSRVFSRAQELSRLKVKDIMVEKSAVKFLSSDLTLAQALVEAHLHHHTRFPLIRGEDPDEVIGYVNFKDIVSALQLNPSDPSLTGICRPILAVQAEESLSSLLDKLTREYQHMVVVKDRGGRVVGLATLEDALEAVLGGVSEKAGRLPDYYYPIAENRWVAGGGIGVQTLRGKLHLKLPDLDETLDSMLRQLCRGSPSVERKIEIMGASFTIRRMSGPHIREAIIEAGLREKRSSRRRRR